MHYSLYMHSESHNIIGFHVGVQRGMIVGLSGEGNQMGQRSALSNWISYPLWRRMPVDATATAAPSPGRA